MAFGSLGLFHCSDFQDHGKPSVRAGCFLILYCQNEADFQIRQNDTGAIFPVSVEESQSLLTVVIVAS
jgi:hypothetical protein